MDYDKKIQAMGDGSAGILIPADLLKWLDLQLGDEVMLRDEVNKRGQRYASFWKKGK
jgi:antitoxin component of MazEF toxin-antitoxin module